MNFGAGRAERLRAHIPASEAEHPVARRNQVLDDRRADPACGSSDEYTHGEISYSLKTNFPDPCILVK